MAILAMKGYGPTGPPPVFAMAVTAIAPSRAGTPVPRPLHPAHAGVTLRA